MTGIMDTDTGRAVVSVMCKAGFEESELLEGARLSKDLDIDSTELVEIVVALEEHFDIAIDADAESAFRTMGDLVDHVTRLRSRGEPVGAAATEG